MNHTLIKSVVLASALVLPFVSSNAFAHGMKYGKSCGYHGWHHPHGYGKGYGKSGHGHGYGHGYGHGKHYWMPRHGYGYHHGKMYGKGGYGHYPMWKMGGYGYGKPSYASPKMSETEDPASSAKDIVDTAVSAGSFTTLVEAVKAAGLVDTLRGEGPFTVFAPTDEAFAKIPADQLNALLQDKDKLTAVLTYHVAPETLRAKDVVKRDSISTVQGQSLSVKADETGVRIDEAKVTKTDIIASNGVIHIIDTVVLPN